MHSMKDVPALQPDGLEIVAIMAREDVRDAFVSNTFLHPDALPEGARVGSSSLRRRAQLLERYPHLRVEDLRGNVATRLRRLDEGHYDAIILAAAGLKRLGLPDRITHLLDIDRSLPAVGQGAIGIEARSDDRRTRELLAPLADADTQNCVLAERSMNQVLGGDCRLPVAALARWQGPQMLLRGLVATPDGRRVLPRRRAATPSPWAWPSLRPWSRKGRQRLSRTSGTHEQHHTARQGHRGYPAARADRRDADPVGGARRAPHTVSRRRDRGAGELAIPG